jgi:hypothetical protein
MRTIGYLSPREHSLKLTLATNAVCSDCWAVDAADGGGGGTERSRGARDAGDANLLPSIVGGAGTGGMIKASARTEEQHKVLQSEFAALLQELGEDLDDDGGDDVGVEGGAPSAPCSRLLERTLKPRLDAPLPPFEPAIGGVVDDKGCRIKEPKVGGRWDGAAGAASSSREG